MALRQETLDRLWDFDDPARSLDRFEAAMLGAGDPEVMAELRTQCARALGLLERYDEAWLMLDAVPDTSLVVAIRVALERGRLRHAAGDIEGALPLLRLAENLADDAEEFFLQLEALHLLALADPEGAEDWTDEAFRVLQRVRDPHTLHWKVILYRDSGEALLAAGRAAEALARFESARDAALRWGTPAEVEVVELSIARAREASDH